MEGVSEFIPHDSTAGERPLNVLFVDDDELFREALATNLRDEGIEVQSFAGGRELLDFVARHGSNSYDVLLLDLKMPGQDGIELLRALRGLGVRMPALFLTLYNEEVHEQAALEGGAVDFVDKTRSVTILATGLRIIAEGAKLAGTERATTELFVVGDLTLNVHSARGFWREQPLALTVTQFRIVHLLASQAGQDVSYREIYDTVHGAGFAAGDGEQGYRVNVRSLIKRIRRSFQAVDPNFAAIRNYAAFGYRWQGPRPPG
jgi:two-component system response regulator ChvI